jgi:hypothetical protein
MMPFETVFPDLAKNEVRVIHALDHDDLPRGTYLFRELSCNVPAHPDHAKVRSEEHDAPPSRLAFPRQEPVRRAGPKVGPNAPCPCGSGKKYKRCCRP